MPDNIQSRRSAYAFTLGGDMGGTPHIATDSDGNPNVFNVERDADGLWLDDNWARPDNDWHPDDRWLFVSRNSLHFSLGFVLREFCFNMLG
jgi:hypothetical protein